MRKESSHQAAVEQKLLAGTDFKSRESPGGSAICRLWGESIAGSGPTSYFSVDSLPSVELQGLLSEEPVGWFCLGASSGGCGVCCCRAVLLSGKGGIEKSIFGAGGLPDTPLHCACLFCSQPPSTNTPDSQALRAGGKEGTRAGERAGSEHTRSDWSEVETFWSCSFIQRSLVFRNSCFRARLPSQ